MYSVLLVEDDIQLSKIIKRILESKDFFVFLVEDGKKALELIKKRDFDFYLIDINIPSINGLELVKFIKEMDKKGKILMITASVEEENFKKAYEYGCDDYIKKPFHATELEVRMNKLMDDKIEFDGYKFYFDTKDLVKNNKIVDLRKKEKFLLYLLLKNVNKTVPTEKIVEFVWGDDKKNPPIRQLVKELREKFDKDYIKTVVGVGYRFEI